MPEPSQRHRSKWTAPFRWLSRELSRLRLTVWLLIVMAVAMIVGSVFPQGYDADTYIESWGEAKYEALARWDLLNLFHSKFFLILGVILLLNLLVCSLVRWFARSGGGLAGARPPAHAREVELAAGAGAGSAVSRSASVLQSKGYKVLSAVGNIVTARRGPWPEGVSLLYHLALVVAIIGFILSALFSFEGDATLYPGEPVTIPTVNAETGAFGLRTQLSEWSIGSWRPFAGARPDTTTWGDRSVTVALKEFRTEWELHQEKYYPKDWLSDLTITDDNGQTRDALVEVNRPLRVSGLTFYQMAYEQEFDVVVLSDTLEVERAHANAYVPFTLESIGGMFFPGTMRVGTLFEKYHDSRPVVPHTPLKWQPPTESEEDGAEAHSEADGEEHGEEGNAAEEEPAPPPPEQIELGDLSAGEPLEVEGFTLKLENPYEASVLTYRHDPGVTPLYIAIVAFLVGLAIRTYWPSYRLSLWIDEAPGGPSRGRLAFRATGMLGDPQSIEEALVDALASKDVASKNA